jgi:hypothetical protein
VCSQSGFCGEGKNIRNLVLRDVMVCSGVDIPTFRRNVVSLIFNGFDVFYNSTAHEALRSFEALGSANIATERNVREDQNPQHQCCGNHEFRT